MKLEDHLTVQRIRLKAESSVPPAKESLDAGWLKQLVLDAGADDVGFVEIGRRLNLLRLSPVLSKVLPQLLDCLFGHRTIEVLPAMKG